MREHVLECPVRWFVWCRFDCNNAGLIVEAFNHFLKQRREKQRKLEQQKLARKLKREAQASAEAVGGAEDGAGGAGGDDAPAPPNLDATRAGAGPAGGSSSSAAAGSSASGAAAPVDDCRQILLAACASHETLPGVLLLPAKGGTVAFLVLTTDFCSVCFSES